MNMNGVSRMWGQVFTTKPDRQKIEAVMSCTNSNTLDYAQVERLLIEELIEHKELPVIGTRYVYMCLL